MAKAETETAERTPVDPTIYLGKAATPLQARFGDWIKEEVGYNPATAKTKEDAFREGVRIATATRMVFQASDFNKAANAEQMAANAAERERRAAEKAAAEKAAPAPAKAAAAPKPAKATKPAKAAPAKAAPAPAAEEAPAAPRPTRRPARRAAATATAAEAPF